MRYRPKYKTISLAGSQKNFCLIIINLNVQEISSKNFSSFNDDDGFLGAGEICWRDKKLKTNIQSMKKLFVL